jgi:hypothetical protein
MFALIGRIEVNSLAELLVLIEGAVANEDAVVVSQSIVDAQLVIVLYFLGEGAVKDYLANLLERRQLAEKFGGECKFDDF